MCGGGVPIVCLCVRVYAIVCVCSLESIPPVVLLIYVCVCARASVCTFVFMYSIRICVCGSSLLAQGRVYVRACSRTYVYVCVYKGFFREGCEMLFPSLSAAAAATTTRPHPDTISLHILLWMLPKPPPPFLKR